MNKTTRNLLNLTLGLTTAWSVSAAGIEEKTANEATPAALPSQTLPLLNFQIDHATDFVNLVNTNSDPYVFTRVYKLKHADPYEIRPYLMAAVRSRRVNANDTRVEAIKFMDGTGMVIVSAEEYRFTKSANNVMTIDELVASFDRPELSSESGRKFFVYYAKYFDAVTLATLIRNVGTQHADDPTELAGGIDTVRPDLGLNALMFYCTPASAKNINQMLGEYDGPTTEAEITYTIYELYHENDGNIGVDFQAWKNGAGTDLFAAGASYLSGLPVDAANRVKDAHANFINFNPRWNSKFLDFLVARSNAKVVTSGSLAIMNKTTGSVSSTTSFPTIGDGEEETPATPGDIRIVADPDGGVKIVANPETPAETISTPKLRTTRNVELGFQLAMTPEVNGKATIVQLAMSNTSLIGFKNDGSPRTSRSELASKLMVGNETQTFYIGGLEKSELIRSVSKVPFLGSIPYLGFLFSAENEQVKKSRLVAVLTIKPLMPDSAAPAEMLKEGADTREKVATFGIKKEYLDENEYGFGQFGNVD